MRVRSRLRLLRERFIRFCWHWLHKLPLFVMRVPNCPICEGDSVAEARNPLFELRRCLDCGHVYTETVPGRYLLGLLYAGMYYWQLDKEHQGIRHICYDKEWDGFLGARMKAVAKIGLTCDSDVKYDVYEIGCSEGMLVARLQSCGHRVRGCDLNPDIVARGAETLKIDIVAGWFEDLPLEPDGYDAVLSFHTLEHLINPHTVMHKIGLILRHAGAVLVEVPGGEEEYRNLDHLHFFSPESLRRLLARTFSEVEIVENAYVNSAGVRIVSYYGIGRGVTAKQSDAAL